MNSFPLPAKCLSKNCGLIFKSPLSIKDLPDINLVVSTDRNYDCPTCGSQGILHKGTYRIQNLKIEISACTTEARSVVNLYKNTDPN